MSRNVRMARTVVWRGQLSVAWILSTLLAWCMGASEGSVIVKVRLSSIQRSRVLFSGHLGSSAMLTRRNAMPGSMKGSERATQRPRQRWLHSLATWQQSVLPSSNLPTFPPNPSSRATSPWTPLPLCQPILGLESLRQASKVSIGMIGTGSGVGSNGRWIGQPICHRERAGTRSRPCRPLPGILALADPIDACSRVSSPKHVSGHSWVALIARTQVRGGRAAPPRAGAGRGCSHPRSSPIYPPCPLPLTPRAPLRAALLTSK